MKPEEWSRLREILERALELEQDARLAYLDEACAGDEMLRREAEELLAQDDDGDDLLPATDDFGPGTLLSSYRIREKIDSGGMGTVFLAERADDQFEKIVAVKVIKRGMDSDEILRRFELERMVLARLEHPGIARLIDAGVTDRGQPFIVMEYVDGIEIDRFCNERSLSVVERIELFRQVCEVVHHAHQNLVVHRDLKPNNILVGKDGRPKLLDFGISKLLDPDQDQTITLARFPLTPEYASPEQTRGEAVSTASDVYSLGVILYELMTGTRPYRFESRSLTELEHVVCNVDPPRPSGTTDTRARKAQLAGDIDNIVLKAMQKDPQRRYASAEQLSEDLLRHLKGHPVLARADTRWYRTTKFVRRNRVAVTTGTLVLLALIASLVTSLVAYDRVFAANIVVNAQRSTLAEKNAELVARQNEILGLSDRTLLEQYVLEIDSLWPAWPERVPDMQTWLDKARALRDRIELHHRTIWRMRANDARERTPEIDRLAALLANDEVPEEEAADHIAALQESVVGGPWTFEDTQDQWQHDTFVTLVAELERFAHGDESTFSIAMIEARVRRANELEAIATEYEEAWLDCIERIADTYESPRYAGLELEPAIALVPLGPDPVTGLWEFADAQTGSIPERDADDELVLDDDPAIVFVLVPAGTYLAGSQGTNENDDHYDTNTRTIETPVHEIELDAFLISKYEMTHSQWNSVMQDNPSEYPNSRSFRAQAPLSRYPVDNVHWHGANEVTRRLGMLLPTEAQWEVAARAESGFPWWPGVDPALLFDVGNVSDATFAKRGAPPGWHSGSWDDGFSQHAPIGSFRANAFGLHDVHGNVHEWVRDDAGDYDREARSGDGHRPDTPEPRKKTLRGGSFNGTADDARSAYRFTTTPDSYFHGTGLRPSRPIRRVR